MPTGDMPSQAEAFGVSNIAIFLSITLFVLGFGIGPLLFAPRKLFLPLTAPNGRLTIISFGADWT
jgi:hypothetical protein